jgi:hypothetical protein
MIPLKTHKMLWGRAANVCAFPDCKKLLVADETETDDPSVIGEEAHIVAKKENGPRGISPLTEEQRNKYDNLILLCSIHHKIIDDQENEYTVEKLKSFKKAHEEWVIKNLFNDKKKIKDDELYATYIDDFIKATDLHNWINWTSWMFGQSESFQKERYEALRELSNYIVSRIWPGRYPKLECAFTNFKNVLNSLILVFDRTLEESGNSYKIERFYRHYRDQKVYEGMLKKYEYHVALVEDLLLELTRAANYICEHIREFIFEGFRLKEGVILITRGDMVSGYTSLRVEYRGDERIDMPYPGLKEFMTLRNSRDLHIGEGINEDYFKNIFW